MRRDSGRRKETQKAEYRNRKEGMETGWTEEERSTGGTAVRGEREEGKGKNGRLSSRNRKGSGRKNAETAGVRKRKGSGNSRGMDGPETSEAQAEDKGEPEEAAAEIESGGRRKEIADEIMRSRLYSRDPF